MKDSASYVVKSKAISSTAKIVYTLFRNVSHILLTFNSNPLLQFIAWIIHNAGIMYNMCRSVQIS